MGKTYAQLLAENPEMYWALVYAALGGVYAGLTISLAVTARFATLWRLRFPKRRGHLFALQFLWSIPQLMAVFLVPILVGTFAREVLVASKYIWVMLGVWIAGTSLAYFIAKPFVDFRKFFDDAG